MVVNSVVCTQTVYQQPSTGEKHVLFYPTSPAPSQNDRRWSDASSSAAQNNQTTVNHHCSNSNLAHCRTGASSGPHADLEKIEDRGTRTKQWDWRRKCIFGLALSLITVVIVNLTLTLWVFKVMEISMDGIGPLKTIVSGIKLDGKIFVMDRLIASSISSRSTQPIIAESSGNLTLCIKSRRSPQRTALLLGNGRFQCTTNSFEILNDHSVLFSANQQEVFINTESLRVTTEGGTVFSGPVKTSVVRAESGSNLRLESRRSSLEIAASRDVNIKSYGGTVRAVSQNDLSLKTKGAAILESASIKMPFLPIFDEANIQHKSFQLCICHDGKFFLASSTSTCYTQEPNLICRKHSD